MEIIEMNGHTKINKTMWIAIAVVVALITAGAVLAIINKQTTESEVPGQPEVAFTYNSGLEDIIKSAQSWEVAFKPWFGKAAPDFKVMDIEGRQHSLSGYHGKNVLVVFWATWCPPCNEEIPNLIKLRKAISEDNLAIIAISNEEPDLVKHFAAAKGINYTIASIQSGALPSPFSDVISIPTTFFIGRDGQIKLAAVGLVTLKETQAIIKAES